MYNTLLIILATILTSMLVWGRLTPAFREKYPVKVFRLVAIIAVLGFMFIEELILKPLRKIKIVLLERTIKRLNGYWTIGILVTLKTCEGLMKIIMIIFPEPTTVTIIIILDGLFGFISMNLIIHGRENLEEFAWYMRFANWIDGLKEEVKTLPVYQTAQARVVEIKAWIRETWAVVRFKVFGKRNPRSIIRYVRSVVYIWNKRRQKRQS